MNSIETELVKSGERFMGEVRALLKLVNTSHKSYKPNLLTQIIDIKHHLEFGGPVSIECAMDCVKAIIDQLQVDESNSNESDAITLLCEALDAHRCQNVSAWFWNNIDRINSVIGQRKMCNLAKTCTTCKNINKKSTAFSMYDCDHCTNYSCYMS